MKNLCRLVAARRRRDRIARDVKALERHRRRLSLSISNAVDEQVATNARYLELLRARAQAEGAVLAARQAIWDAQRKRADNLPATFEHYGNVAVAVVAVVVLVLIFWGVLR